MKLLLVFVVVWQFDLSLESACNTGSDKNVYQCQTFPTAVCTRKEQMKREGSHAKMATSLSGPVSLPEPRKFVKENTIVYKMGVEKPVVLNLNQKGAKGALQAWKQIVKKMKLVEPAPLDCSDIRPRVERGGVYVIYPSGLQAPVPVFCDITNDGGPWTVFQKRFNGSLDFYRRWHDYRHGFGQADGEYWLGLQSIHLLTLQRKYELRIDLEDFEGNTASARYAEFSVSPGAINAALDGYTLHVAGFSDGGAGDSLTPHSGAKFSTLDRDRDMHVQHCAQYARGAFWYHDDGCVTANLNGRYLGPRPRSALEIGFTWSSWHGPDYSLKRSEMKIRPVMGIDDETLV